MSEKSPGSQPIEIIPTFPDSLAALSTFAKCSGILACVSKLSITLNNFANSGVCVGKSLALPPQIIRTSISEACLAASETEYTGTLFVIILTVDGSLLVNTALSSISSF